MKRIIFAIVFVFATVGAHAQLLYKISGHGLKSPSYIVGTYHLANVSFVDSIPGIRQAMEATQQTYGELVMNELLSPDSLQLMEKAMLLPEGMTIDKLLSADEMGRLNAFLKVLLILPEKQAHGCPSPPPYMKPSTECSSWRQIPL